MQLKIWRKQHGKIQWILALAALPLASCGQGNEQADTTDAAPTAVTPVAPETAVSAPAANAQPAKLVQCKVCHSFDEGGADLLGPNLWDVYGKPAASDDDFAYSTALRNAGLVWDDAALDAYLTNPRNTVPGGKMSFAGMKNSEDRQEIIKFLSTLNNGS